MCKKDIFHCKQEECLNKYECLRNFLLANAKFFNKNNLNEIPNNKGIYFMFEENQYDIDSQKRIVRVGKSNNLYKRIVKQHCNGNSNNSIFRKHLSNALNENDNKEISEYIKNNFSFSIIRIPSILSCDEMEKELIKLIANHSKNLNVNNWIGLNSRNENIVNNKIWNHQDTQNSYDTYLNNLYLELIDIGLIKQ